jgi:16S rRNA (guanine966-N2)-methyltransferase
MPRENQAVALRSNRGTKGDDRRGRGLRVIAGAARGLHLATPRGNTTRPITDRAKESLFGHLTPDLEGARVLDLFAGSGALAIEALSRGAERAVLVERDPSALDVIAANVASTRLTGRTRVHRGDVVSFIGSLPAPEGPFDIVFCDPPFAAEDEWVRNLLDALVRRGWLEEDGIVVVRRAAPPADDAVDGPRASLPEGWGIRWRRTFGDTLVLVTAPFPDGGDDGGDVVPEPEPIDDPST